MQVLLAMQHGLHSALQMDHNYWGKFSGCMAIALPCTDTIEGFSTDWALMWPYTDRFGWHLPISCEFCMSCAQLAKDWEEDYKQYIVPLFRQDRNLHVRTYWTQLWQLGMDHWSPSDFLLVSMLRGQTFHHGVHELLVPEDQWYALNHRVWDLAIALSFV